MIIIEQAYKKIKINFLLIYLYEGKSFLMIVRFTLTKYMTNYIIWLGLHFERRYK